MRILQLAPLWETVPPKTYGGTEMVVHLLTGELIRRGHQVTLVTCGGTRLPDHPNLTVWPFNQDSLRSMGVKGGEAALYELIATDAVYRRAKEFDIIHNHMGLIPLSFANQVNTPTVTTLHGAFIPGAATEYFEHYRELPYISISQSQRTPMPDLNYVGTIYHGLPLARYRYNLNPAETRYLAFLGRFSPEKGPHYAIQVAKALGLKLVMAGKIDPVDEGYYNEQIAPHVDNQQIFNIGEVNHEQKVALLNNAMATLCPVTWPEPFGLVLAESMACGTPVVALRNGSIPEVIAHGQTGFVADTVAELIDYTWQIGRIDRRACRTRVEDYFSVTRMVDEHLNVYEKLAAKSQRSALEATDSAKVVPMAPAAVPLTSAKSARLGTTTSSWA